MVTVTEVATRILSQTLTCQCQTNKGDLFVCHNKSVQDTNILFRVDLNANNVIDMYIFLHFLTFEAVGHSNDQNDVHDKHILMNFIIELKMDVK